MLQHIKIIKLKNFTSVCKANAKLINSFPNDLYYINLMRMFGVQAQAKVIGVYFIFILFSYNCVIFYVNNS